MDGGQRPPGLTPRRATSPAQERLDRAGGHLGPDGRAEALQDRLRRLARGARPAPEPVPLNDTGEAGRDVVLAAFPNAEILADWVRWDQHDKRTGVMVEGWRDAVTGEWRPALP